ncbi:MAG: DUF3035 domain-containing protein [Alphaproteobacteria bacterium]|nr:DUF3035 domain-containing protein [Alphaproteobacteria bacterium]
MRKFLLIGLVLLAAGCSWGKQELGLANNSPDESLVEVRKPLSLPPEFDVRPIVSPVQQNED